MSRQLENILSIANNIVSIADIVTYILGKYDRYNEQKQINDALKVLGARVKELQPRIFDPSSRVLDITTSQYDAAIECIETFVMIARLNEKIDAYDFAIRYKQLAREQAVIIYKRLQVSAPRSIEFDIIGRLLETLT